MLFSHKNQNKPQKTLRRQTILPKHLKNVFLVNNGKTDISVRVSPKMLGHKFGEFAVTRQKPFHKKKKAK